MIALRTLTGAAYEQTDHGAVTDQALWDILSAADADTDMIQTGTPEGSNGDRDANGLVLGHGYLTLGVIELSDGVQLVKMRNPWASEVYTGPWCDSCSEWESHATAKSEAGWEVADDGIFYMPIGLYRTAFVETAVSHDMTNWSRDYFLMLNDTTVSPGRLPWCGSSCTSHRLILASDTTQDVFLTVHTWDDRTMGDACRNVWRNYTKFHSVKVPGDRYHRTFR